MTNPSPKEIVKRANHRSTASVISGEPFPCRMQSTPDLRKTINLALKVKGNNHASSDLSLNRFTSVTYVDLDSLTYADGATWKASSPAACSVSPEPFMLVSAARE